MFFKNDPSNPVEGFRYPNLQIVDDAFIFASSPGGILGYPIDATEYFVLSNNIKLFIYTSVGERPDWKNINLSSNDIAIFIFKSPVQLEFRIKLSDNLCLLSKFSRSIQQMLNYKVILYEKNFIGKKLSIEYVLSLFDTIDEPLLNIVSNKEAEITAKKSIKISKRGSLDFIPPKPIEGKLNITIGLFFDGTGNNKFNSERVHDVFASLAEERGKLFSEIINENHSFVSEKGMVFNDFMFKPKSSYLNKKSNISELYDLYNTTTENEIDVSKELIHKIYIEGIGTKKDKEDSDFGSGLGRDGFKIEQTILGIRFRELPYGVTSRCLEAILLVSNYLKELQQKRSKEIGQVVLDIFGFSRGAAAARLFYRKLFRENIFNEENKKNNVKIQSYKIRFFGLFDTVLSYSDTYQDDISLKLCSSPCYHIIAQDEIRENFPLTHVDAENSVLLELFGCHSDIGGSYTRDKFSATFAFDESEKSQPAYELRKLYNDYKLRYAVDTSKKYFKYFVDQVSLKHKQVRIQQSDSQNEEPKILEGYVAVDRRIIESDISKISLQAMLLFASKHKLPFKEFEFKYSSKLSAEEKKALSEYKNLVEIIIDDLKNGSEKTDYLKDKKNFFNLYHKFIHISESYEYQIFSSIYNGEVNEYGNMLYSDRPTEKGVRVEYLKEH